MRGRQKLANAPMLFRARIYEIRPDGVRGSWVDGPYGSQREAAARIDFWKNWYVKNGRADWKVTGSTEEASMTWRPVY